jgi:hypothetical protein
VIPFVAPLVAPERVALSELAAIDVPAVPVEGAPVDRMGELVDPARRISSASVPQTELVTVQVSFWLAGVAV